MVVDVVVVDVNFVVYNTYADDGSSSFSVGGFFKQDLKELDLFGN